MKRSFKNALCWTVSEYRQHDLLDKLNVVTGKPTSQWLRLLQLTRRGTLRRHADKIAHTDDLNALQQFVPATVEWVSFALAITALARIDYELKAAPADLIIAVPRFHDRFRSEFYSLLAQLTVPSTAVREAEHV